MQTNTTKKVVTNQRIGGTDIVEEDTVVSTSDSVTAQDYQLAKAHQTIWYIAHFIAIILGLRFLFLLLGANLTGIVLFIYNISEVLILPFRGIFPAADAGVSYFDPAALVGILMYYLLAFIVGKLFVLFSSNTSD